ncbi:hypothetical protein ADUPG1_013836 [Aduncisulcus paluster]|uniref:Uncharacterized protein n=1 Tax=Aduncisulcus paluster TaxID=2918883 RepID=A0ABQ5K8E2_9EUKA|nr:hypothetical protein ADUPG1_013836 [Aduncisulcus paluster]
MDKFFLSDYNLKGFCLFPKLFSPSIFAILAAKKDLGQILHEIGEDEMSRCSVFILCSNHFIPSCTITSTFQILNNDTLIEKKITNDMLLQQIELPPSYSEYDSIMFHKDGTRLAIASESQIQIFSIQMYGPSDALSFGISVPPQLQSVSIPCVIPESMIHIPKPSHDDMMKHQ